MTRNEKSRRAAGSTQPAGPPVQIIGIGADGWEGLGAPARRALENAQVVLGSPRQLDLLPPHVAAQRVAWPSPLRPAVAPLLSQHGPSGLAVLASGDPMHFGVGRLIVDALATAGPSGSDGPRWVVHPQPSSMSLACARLGWPVEDVEVVSAVGRDVRTVRARLAPGRRILVLSCDADTPAQVAEVLCDGGYGLSRMRVLGNLGTPDESTFEAAAAHWPSAASLPRLNIVAIECAPDSDPRADAGAVADGDASSRTAWPGLVPGLPDTVYETDGQLTKWEVRAVTLAALAPAPGELLWDVGGGSGSIGIEWMRSHPSCRAVAVELRSDRAAVIAANAGRLGVPGLRVVVGAAPAALTDLTGPVELAGVSGSESSERPDAVFIGGGLTTPGLIEACWDALRPGGRLVANTVTLESEALLTRLRERLGGRLTRLEVSRAEPIGGYLGWRPARPVTQWSTRKPTT